MASAIILKPNEKHYSKFEVTLLDADYSDFDRVHNEETGVLHITSQRIVFVGPNTNRSLQMEKLLACSGTENTLTLNIANEKTIEYDTGIVSASSATEQILSIVEKAETIPSIKESTAWIEEQKRKQAWMDYHQKETEAKAIAEKQRLARKAKNSERLLIAAIMIIILMVLYVKLF